MIAKREATKRTMPPAASILKNSRITGIHLVSVQPFYNPSRSTVDGVAQSPKQMPSWRAVLTSG